MGVNAIRAFICPPFHSCPHCGKAGYGNVLIFGTSVLMQCNQCGWEDYEKLPELRKQLLYADQFLISEYANFIKGGQQALQVMQEKPRRAVIALSHLRRYQLAVCPESEYHRMETERSKRREHHRLSYESLSAGTDWRMAHEISASQAREHARAWAEGRSPQWQFHRNEAVRSDRDLDHWEPQLSVHVRFQDDAQRRQEAEERFRRMDADFEHINRAWKKMPMSFVDVFRAESANTGHMHVRQYDRQRQNFVDAVKAGRPLGLLTHPKHSVSGVWLDHVLLGFSDAGMGHDEGLQKIPQYVSSADFSLIPHVDIGCSLWAQWAMIVNRGGKGVTASDCNDIGFIQSYLPYCDAMFIDTKQYVRLQEIRHEQGRLTGYLTRLFSYANLDEFEQWVNQLVAAMSPEHRATLSRYYGIVPEG